MATPDFVVDALKNEISSLSERIAVMQNSRKLQNNFVGSPTSVGDAGHTAWMLASCALVLFMTMPGLAIYYGGMVGQKNVLATIMQSFTICCVITVVWLSIGYSLSFTPTHYFSNGSEDQQFKTLIIGNLDRVWLRGMNILGTNFEMNGFIPESVYCMYQLTFAIITAALICGSFADRMKYWSMVIFIVLWHLAAYCPIAHATWHHNGILFKMGVLDFAGGNVVHIASGTAGLVAALILGNRKGWKPKDYSSHPPHNILLTFIGMCMLWVGWFGFNAGSAGAANPNAAFAMLATQIATGTGSLAWMLTEFIFRKKPSVLGMVNGAVAGLVSITPACGYVDMTGAFFIGLFGGVLCYFGAQLKHYVFKIDDSLDAFGIHAIGGIIGGIATGFFANPQITGNVGLGYGTQYAKGALFPTDAVGVYYGNMWMGGHQLAKQIVGILYNMTWSGIVTFVILKTLDLTIGIRVTAEQEEAGLDVSLHGESVHNDEAIVTKAEPMQVTDNPAYA